MEITAVISILSWINDLLVILSYGNNRNIALVVLATLESNYAVNQRVKSVVATHTDVCTGVVYCTTLTNEDITGLAYLATPDFNT